MKNSLETKFLKNSLGTKNSKFHNLSTKNLIVVFFNFLCSFMKRNYKITHRPEVGFVILTSKNTHQHNFFFLAVYHWRGKTTPFSTLFLPLFLSRIQKKHSRTIHVIDNIQRYSLKHPNRAQPTVSMSPIHPISSS